jgi:hypothetical protein
MFIEMMNLGLVHEMRMNDTKAVGIAVSKINKGR